MINPKMRCLASGTPTKGNQQFLVKFNKNGSLGKEFQAVPEEEEFQTSDAACGKKK